MKIPFLDLKINLASRRKEYLKAIEKVMMHGRFVIGPEVDDFEQRVAQYTNTKYAVAVSSGTDALILALRALGIALGDEVIIPAMTFVATANAVKLVGASPRLADINDDFNISIESIKKLINKNTKAIMPVHYAGKIAAMEEINALAKKYGLYVIEDASQAFGAIRHNQYAGTIGDLGCISLNPMKILGAIGEAGVIFTENHLLYEKLKILRYNGLKDRSDCVEISSNCKPDTIIAAVLIEQLKMVDSVIVKRREIAEFYRNVLPKEIDCPNDYDEHCKDVYYTFTIKCNERDQLQSYLAKNGIETKIYHPVVSDEPVYRHINDDVTNARQLFKRKLALPCNEKLSMEQVSYVAEKIKEFYN